MKIVIIDSGISNNEKVNGIHFFYKDGEICEDEDIIDNIGHGTALYNIIMSHNNVVEFYVIKVCNSEEDIVNEDLLEYVLNYIYDNVECNIVNLSLGIRICNVKKELKEICEKLRNKGVILVSAFDNEGAISYPAAFNSVIGVVSSDNCHRPEEVIFLDNSSMLNIYGYGSMQRVKWKDGRYSMVEGNSYACAHVSGILSNIDKNKISFNDALIFLKSKSMYVIINKQEEVKFDNNCEDVVSSYHKAVLFPFNKEMHSVVRFQDLLLFDIVGVYDFKYSLNNGAFTDSILKTRCKKNFQIENINNIQWEQFDTIIIGHIEVLMEITNSKDIINDLLIEANKRGKNIYAFDDLEGMFPEIEFNNTFMFKQDTKNRDYALPFGMLYTQEFPVVGVFGTTSKQGKFTLQLLLRRELMKKGYSVGQLGSEPSSFLFGMDECFHFGYGRELYLDEYQIVALLNQKMNLIAMNKPDIIITGSQGGTITSNTSNLGYYTFVQTNFILGTLPDVVILCVNTFDEEKEILRTISYIESIIETSVVAIVVFPTMVQENKYGTRKIVDLPSEKYEMIRKSYKRKYNKEIYILNSYPDMNELVDNILDRF